MKQITLLFFSLCWFSMLNAQKPSTEIRLLSSSPESTVFQVTIGKIVSREVPLNGERAVLPVIEHGTPFLIKGAPDLPKIAQLLQIPERGDMAFEVLAGEYEDIRDVLVVPSKGNLTRNIDPDLIAYEFGKWYQKDAFFPGQLAQLKDPFIQRNIRGQAVWVQPVQYNPVQKILRIYSSLTIRVYTTGGKGINELPESAPRGKVQSFEGIYQKAFLNYPTSFGNSGGNAPEKLLVIAPDDFVEELEPLITWKQQSGIHTTLVTLSSIGSADADVIRNYIKQFYTDHAITYVLLVGDAQQIKPEMRPSGGSDYSCDNCFGYMNDEDHIQDVLVGRLHAKNTDELETMVQRILEYEKNPLVDVTANWCATGMASASAEGAGFGDDGQADYEHANEWKTKHLQNGFQEYWEFYDGDQSAISPTPGSPSADQPGNPSNGGIIDLMNQRGVSLYNYTGHGWEQGLVSGNFTTDAVSALRNYGRYPILIAVACCAGNFTNNNGGDCLGEAWQRAGDPVTGEPWGGIAGFFSSDYQSWSPPMEGQDGMNQYLTDAEGVQLFPSIGGMAAFGNLLMIGAYGSNGELMADFWNPFADPTTLPRTNLPLQLTAAHDTLKYIGDYSMIVSCPVEGARVGLYWEGQTLSTATVTNGVAVLFFSPLIQVGELTVTVTQFNYIPYQGIIPVVPLSGPFVIQQNLIIDDQSGNNNQLADYLESVLLNVEIQNVGLSEAIGTTLELSTASPWISLTDSLEDVGVMDGGALLTLPGIFAFTVADGVPHGEMAEFTLTIHFNDSFDIPTTFITPLQAPSLEAGAHNLQDMLPGGNGNGRLESGESLILNILNRNIGGSTSSMVAGALISNSPWVLVNGPVLLPGLNPDQEAEAGFQLEVVAGAPVNEQVFIEYTATAGAYSASKVLGPFFINPIVADFEVDNLIQLAWDTAFAFPWIISAESPYQGDLCMESAEISEDESSQLRLTLNVIQDSEIGFARRVSSELDWDYLRFYIDGNLQAEWSGEQSWETFRYPVTSGQHTFLWSYDKDEYISDGSDKSWIDEIFLPLSEELVSSNASFESDLNLHIAPNPVEDQVLIAWNAQIASPMCIELLSATGHKLLELKESNRIEGYGQRVLDVSPYPPGIYFLRFIHGSSSTVEKIIKGK